MVVTKASSGAIPAKACGLAPRACVTSPRRIVAFDNTLAAWIAAEESTPGMVVWLAHILFFDWRLF